MKNGKSIKLQKIDSAYELFRAGAYEDALKAFKQLSYLNDAAVEYGKARCYDAMGRFEDGLEIYEKIKEKHPNYIPAHLAIAYSFHHLKMYDKAIMEAEKIRRKLGDLEDVLLCEARCHLGIPDDGLGHEDIAIAKLQEVIKKYKNSAEAYQMLLHAYDNANRNQEAFELYSSVNKNPTLSNYKELQLSYAIFLQKNNLLQEALNILEKLKAQYPEYVDAYVSCAYTIELTQDFAAAEEAYLKMIAKFQEHEKANLLYAVFLQKQGRLEEAKEHFEKILKFAPRSKEAYLGLAIHYHLTFNFDESINYAVKAIEIDQNYAAAYSTIGHCYLDMNYHHDVTEKVKLQEKAATYFSKAAWIDKRRLVKPDYLMADPLVNYYSSRIKNLNDKKGITATVSEENFSQKNPFQSLSKITSTPQHTLLVAKLHCENLYKQTLPLYNKIDKTNPTTLTSEYINTWHEIEDLLQAGEFNLGKEKLTKLNSKLRLHFAMGSNAFVPGEKWHTEKAATAKEAMTPPVVKNKQTLFAAPFTNTLAAINSDTVILPPTTKACSAQEGCLALFAEISELQSILKKIDTESFPQLFAKKQAALAKIDQIFNDQNYVDALSQLEKIKPKIERMIEIQKEKLAAKPVEETSSKVEQSLPPVKQPIKTHEQVQQLTLTKSKRRKKKPKADKVESFPVQNEPITPNTYNFFDMVENAWYQIKSYCPTISFWSIQKDEVKAVDNEVSIRPGVKIS